MRTERNALVNQGLALMAGMFHQPNVTADVLTAQPKHLLQQRTSEVRTNLKKY
jgi:hypothetical protein